MADQKDLADLRKCMREADGDTTKMATCEKTFADAGGVVDDGKVFSIHDGNAAFVTKKGKVF
ncbi:MAG TPA: hypothetical protein VGQ31_07600 [Candidatus Limnocylindrales bacterium]|nr:hypothetical protein [Candidatus Limnocylindrales bacterium]